MDASRDPDVFLTQVNDQMEEIQAKIDEFLDVSATIFNDAIRAITAGLPGAIKGAWDGFWQHGPFGAGPGAVQGMVDGMLEEYRNGSDQIDVKWRETQEAIRTTIGSITGDPLQMAAIASGYRDAAEMLGNQGNEIRSANAFVAESWTGRAHTAYTNTSTYQLEALSAVVLALGEAAALMDDNQVAMISYWSDQLTHLVSLVTAITTEISEVSDAGEWLTGGVGAIIRAFSATIEASATIVNTFVQYWTQLNVGMAGDWDGLQALIPEKGLENNVWPDFTTVDSGPINQPWETA